MKLLEMEQSSTHHKKKRKKIMFLTTYFYQRWHGYLIDRGKIKRNCSSLSGNEKARHPCNEINVSYSKCK